MSLRRLNDEEHWPCRPRSGSRIINTMNAATWRTEYPFESKAFEIDGVKMHYVDEGDDTTNPVILAVHGNPTWSFYWRSAVSRFRQSNRVVAVDHIGCGLSEKPQQYDYCLNQHAQNLAKLIEHLDLHNIMLLAHDWGGAIGLLTLTRHLDRFSHVVLLNTGAFPPPFIPARIAACRIPFLGTLGMRGLNLFAKAAITMAMSRRRLTKNASRGLLAPYDSWANRVAIDQFVKDIPRSESHRTWQVLEKLESDLANVNLPAKFIWGMRDWCFTPECLYRLQRAMGHAETVEIEDAGHYVMEDATDEVLAAIESFMPRFSS